MDKVVEHCTDWPLWARFSTVMQHQNLDGVEEALQGIGFGGARCRLTTFEGQNDPTDILVLASPRYGGTRTDVTLYFGGQGQRGGLSPDFMAHLLDPPLLNIEMLSSAPRLSEQLLPSIAQSTPLPPQISLLAHDLASSHVVAIDRSATVTATRQVLVESLLVVYLYVLAISNRCLKDSSCTQSVFLLFFDGEFMGESCKLTAIRFSRSSPALQTFTRRLCRLERLYCARHLPL